MDINYYDNDDNKDEINNDINNNNKAGEREVGYIRKPPLGGPPEKGLY